MTERLSELLGSRTVLTLVALLAALNLPEVQALVPKAWLPQLQNVLVLAAVWFRSHPKAEL